MHFFKEVLRLKQSFLCIVVYGRILKKFLTSIRPYSLRFNLIPYNYYMKIKNVTTCPNCFVTNFVCLRIVTTSCKKCFHRFHPEIRPWSMAEIEEYLRRKKFDAYIKWLEMPMKDIVWPPRKVESVPKKSNYWKTTCPSCKRVKSHYRKPESRAFCQFCLESYQTEAQPATREDFMVYQLSLRIKK